MSPSSTLLTEALDKHKAGQLDEAEAIYHRLLADDLQHVDALHHLGIIATQRGQHALAIERIRNAIARNAGVAAFHYNLGCALQACQRFEEAAAAYREAIRLNEHYVEAQHNLGVTQQELKNWDAAIQSFRQVLALNRRHAAAYLQLGKALVQKNIMDEAVGCFLQAAKLKPALAKSIVDTGIDLRRSGRLADAKRCVEVVLRINPRDADAHNQLGAIAESDGNLAEAQRRFELALRHRPQWSTANYNVGRVAVKQKKYDEAEQRLRAAVQQEPANAGAYEALGAVLAGQGSWAESMQMTARAIQLEPTDARRLRWACTLPIVADSVEQTQEQRRRMQQGLRQLSSGNPHLPDPLGLGIVDFYAAYHGQDERAWKSDLASLYLQACPGIDYVAPHCQPDGRHRSAGRRIRVGFISQHLRTHTIGRLNLGLIEQLDRTKCELIVIRQTPQNDELARRISQVADRVVMPTEANSLAAAREAIAALKLDVAYYPDLGMEPWSYFLAFSRLAPVQCVSWGHPVTTGIPAIDYFLSAEHLDSAAAAEHYTERLVRLPQPAVYYRRPVLKQPARTRDYFGLRPDDHVYGCLQTLFKYHPEFDSILGEILRRDSAGVLVLMAGTRSRWNELLLRRLRRTIPDVVERIRLISPQPYSDFLALTALCDVLLDPLHFGGGNTTYEALALGVPVVTLPSAFLRGRIASALYQQMQLLDCVVENAAAYVSLATKLGMDEEFRRHARSRIESACPVLFENRSAVRDLETFFEQAVAESQTC
jgi:protein O-GlcNAc transferase